MAATKTNSLTKKPKLVRDSFTIPKHEYTAIDALKKRAVSLGTSVKKSELLRAGLMALLGTTDAAYKRALVAVPALKTGRPAAVADTQAPAASPAPTSARPARKAAAKATVKIAAKAPVKTASVPAKAPTKRAEIKRTAAKP
jgi:hypothetical protein